MSFGFNFSGDDIEDDGNETKPQTPAHNGQDSRSGPNGEPPAVPVVNHDLEEMLSSLPSSISYTTTILTSPQRQRQTRIPRRALFDVRIQIMAESDPSTPSQPDRIASSLPPRIDTASDEIGLGASDLEQNVYEGGFKSWEGAHDLARLVLERGPRRDIDDLSRVDGVIELGCGQALPTLVLFQHALTSNLALPFTLTDYNASVLRLVTLPNLLLTWALHASPSSFSASTPSLSSSSTTTEGDLAVTPALTAAFLTDLRHRNIALSLISGPWSPQLTTHLTRPLAPDHSLLILAAETIYSPASLAAFAETLVGVLKAVRAGRALVAAKRVYFGVGGSVDAFKEVVAGLGAVVGEVVGSGIEGCEGGGGVGRWIGEVQMF